ncbi:MAG TPA: hypothetical protein VLB68_04290, partial [Pyrinomonadaceae bacterium]|nr:hypothetical protein [Pyrinomonadaceae bacterium]
MGRWGGHGVPPLQADHVSSFTEEQERRKSLNDSQVEQYKASEVVAAMRDDAGPQGTSQPNNDT